LLRWHISTTYKSKNLLGYIWSQPWTLYWSYGQNCSNVELTQLGF
jgi:hypothetical protein